MLYLLCVKSEAFEAFKAFEAWLEIHHGKRLKVLNTDRGGEYLSEEFKTHLEARGITQKLSVHDTHEEAGVSERLNRTLMEKTRALLLTSGLPAYLWGEAVLHAIWLKNRTSTKALDGRTPFEAINGRPPTLLGLPVWGCCVWVHDTSTGKVGVRALAARESPWSGMFALASSCCPLSSTMVSSLRGSRCRAMTSPHPLPTLLRRLPLMSHPRRPPLLSPKSWNRHRVVCRPR